MDGSSQSVDRVLGRSSSGRSRRLSGILDRTGRTAHVKDEIRKSPSDEAEFATWASDREEDERDQVVRSANEQASQ